MYNFIFKLLHKGFTMDILYDLFLHFIRGVFFSLGQRVGSFLLKSCNDIFPRNHDFRNGRNAADFSGLSYISNKEYDSFNYLCLETDALRASIFAVAWGIFILPVLFYNKLCLNTDIGRHLVLVHPFIYSLIALFILTIFILVQCLLNRGIKRREKILNHYALKEINPNYR